MFAHNEQVLIPTRYRLAVLLAALWSSVLLPVQAYVFGAPEVPGWLEPVEAPLRALVDQAKKVFPALDPYYTFGRLFFPSYLLLAYGLVGVARARTGATGRVRRGLTKVLLSASAVGGVADALMYWGGRESDLSTIGGLQLAAWVVEEVALLVMVAATAALGVAVVRGVRANRWTGVLLLAAGLLSLPAGFVTYIPHGVVLVLAVAWFLVMSALSKGHTEPRERR